MYEDYDDALVRYHECLLLNHGDVVLSELSELLLLKNFYDGHDDGGESEVRDHQNCFLMCLLCDHLIRVYHHYDIASYDTYQVIFPCLSISVSAMNYPLKKFIVNHS